MGGTQNCFPALGGFEDRHGRGDLLCCHKRSFSLYMAESLNKGYWESVGFGEVSASTALGAS